MINTHKKVPKLRFPGFSDEWEEKKLGDVTSLFSKRNKNLIDAPVYSVTNYAGFVLQTDHFDKVVAGDDLSSYKIVRKDDFAYNPARVNVGSIARFKNNVGVISSLYVCFRCDKNLLNQVFMDFFLLKSSTKYYINTFGEGGVRIYLWYPLFAMIKIHLPTVQEQEEIAGFLSSVDEKIDLLTKKKELLEKYKKGVMQQLFSQKIRFKDKNGQDYPDWQEKKLGDFSDITTGRLDANAMKDSGQYRFYTCAKEYYRIDQYAFDTEALLISGNGANVGYIHYYKGKFNAYQRTYVIDNFKENIFYIKTYLDGFLKRRIFQEKFEGSMPYIVLSTLKDMPIPTPCESEQKSIADFLGSIDEKIVAEERKLLSAKEFKKALLQQMFV